MAATGVSRHDLKVIDTKIAEGVKVAINQDANSGQKISYLARWIGNFLPEAGKELQKLANDN